MVAELAAESKNLEEDCSEEVSVVAEEEVADLEEQFGSENRRRSGIPAEDATVAAMGMIRMSDVEDEATEETQLLFRDRVRIRISQPSQDTGKQ